MRLLLDTAVVGEIFHPRKNDDVRAWFARAAAAHKMLLFEVDNYDLNDGTWDARNGALREFDEYDAGLRLVLNTRA